MIVKWNSTISLVIGLAILVGGCTVTEKSQRGIKYSVLAGLNRGGITENTDLNLPGIEGTTVDAFSGATRTGTNVGLHLNKPLRYGEIETGVNYMFNHQTFSFADQVNGYNGERKLNVNQIMFPFTYNFVLFKGLLPNAEIQLKVGYLGQVNRIRVTGTGDLPEYSVNPWSNGATLGISAYPLQFNHGSKLGFYFDVYRGSRVYTDFYNQTDFEMPGSSYLKFGLRYQFGKL